MNSDPPGFASSLPGVPYATNVQIPTYGWLLSHLCFFLLPTDAVLSSSV